MDENHRTHIHQCHLQMGSILNFAHPEARNSCKHTSINLGMQAVVKILCKLHVILPS